MEGRLSVMGDCQCSYTGTGNRTRGSLVQSIYITCSLEPVGNRIYWPQSRSISRYAQAIYQTRLHNHVNTSDFVTLIYLESYSRHSLLLLLIKVQAVLIDIKKPRSSCCS